MLIADLFLQYHRIDMSQKSCKYCRFKIVNRYTPVAEGFVVFVKFYPCDPYQTLKWLLCISFLLLFEPLCAYNWHFLESYIVLFLLKWMKDHIDIIDIIKKLKNIDIIKNIISCCQNWWVMLNESIQKSSSCPPLGQQNTTFFPCLIEHFNFTFALLFHLCLLKAWHMLIMFQSCYLSF